MARYKVNSLSFKFWRIFGKCFSFYEKFFWKNALLVTLTRPEKLEKKKLFDFGYFLKWRYSLKFFWNVREIVFIFDFTISVFILVFYQHIFFSPWILTQVLNSIHRSPAPGLSNWLERSIYTFFFLNLIFKSYISTSRLYIFLCMESIYCEVETSCQL